MPSVGIKPRTYRLDALPLQNRHPPPPQKKKKKSRSDRPKHFRQISSVDVQAAQVARFRLETAGTRLTTKPYEFANGKPQSRPRVPMFQYGMFTKWDFHPSTKEKLVIEGACDSGSSPGNFLTFDAQKLLCTQVDRGISVTKATCNSRSSGNARGTSGQQGNLR